jgi:hypothetical protein
LKRGGLTRGYGNGNTNFVRLYEPEKNSFCKRKKLVLTHQKFEPTKYTSETCQ